MKKTDVGIKAERARELLQRLAEIAPDSPLGRRAAEHIGR